jgi:hypothetical protein
MGTTQLHRGRLAQFQNRAFEDKGILHLRARFGKGNKSLGARGFAAKVVDGRFEDY